MQILILKILANYWSRSFSKITISTQLPVVVWNELALMMPRFNWNWLITSSTWSCYILFKWFLVCKLLTNLVTISYIVSFYPGGVDIKRAPCAICETGTFFGCFWIFWNSPNSKAGRCMFKINWSSKLIS